MDINNLDVAKMDIEQILYSANKFKLIVVKDNICFNPSMKVIGGKEFTAKLLSLGIVIFKTIDPKQMLCTIGKTASDGDDVVFAWGYGEKFDLVKKFHIHSIMKNDDIGYIDNSRKDSLTNSVVFNRNAFVCKESEVEYTNIAGNRIPIYHDILSVKFQGKGEWEATCKADVLEMAKDYSSALLGVDRVVNTFA